MLSALQDEGGRRPIVCHPHASVTQTQVLETALATCHWKAHCLPLPQVLLLPVEEEEVGAAQALVEFCYTGALGEGAAASVQELLRVFRLADRLEVGACFVRKRSGSSRGSRRTLCRDWIASPGLPQVCDSFRCLVSGGRLFCIRCTPPLLPPPMWVLIRLCKLPGRCTSHPCA